MAAYPLPPWLQPSDPASAYAQGLQIGSRIGSEQAHQQAEQAAIARQTQLQAVEQAQRQAEFGLKQQAAARRYAAQSKYQALLNQGLDPAKALLQVAPDLGESLTGAAQLYKAGQPATMTPYQQAEIDIKQKELDRKQGVGDAEPKVFPIGPGVDFVYMPGGKTGHVVDRSGKKKEPSLSELQKVRDGTSDPELLQSVDSIIRDKIGALRPKSKKRVKVTGPGGQTGTVEEGDTLPKGWTLQ